MDNFTIQIISLCKKTAAFFAVFFYFAVAQSQIVVLGDSTKLNSLFLSECGRADTFTIHIRVASGSLSAPCVLEDSFPADFIFTSIVPHAAIISATGLGSNKFRLTLSTSVLNGASTGVNLQVLIRAKCAAGNGNNAIHQLKLTASAYSQIRPGKDIIGNVKVPNLLLESRLGLTNLSAVIGSTYTRQWRLRNTGNSSEIDTSWIRIIYQKNTQFVQLRINGTITTPTKTSGDTIWYKVVQYLRNQSVFPGDTVKIEESYQVNSCLNPSDFARATGFWGCFNNALCNITEQFPVTQILNSVPDLKASLVSTKYGCYGNYDTVTLKYWNAGGKATAARLRFDMCYPIEYYQNYLGSAASFGYIDSSSIVSKNGFAGTYARHYLDSYVTYTYTEPYWLQTKPVGAAYLRRNVFNSTDTIYVKFRRFRGAYYDYQACYVADLFTTASATYKNNCATQSYALPMQYLHGEWHGYYGKTNYNGPAYLLNGDTGVFEFTTLQGSGTSHYLEAGHYFMIRWDLPKGVTWVNNNSDLTLTKIGSTYTKTVDSVYYNSSTGILEAYYKNTYGGMNGIRVKPKFYLNCAAPGAASGYKDILIQYFIVKPTQKCGFIKLPYSCQHANSISLICPNASYNRGGIKAYFSQIKRTTYGKPDNNNDGLPDGSGSLDFSKIEWNKLAPRDTFSITYKGRINKGSMSPASFGFGYGRMWLREYGDLFQHINAQITIKDSSSGSTFTVSNLPTTIRDTSGRRTFIYNFSGNVSGFPSGFQYDRGDSFTFVATAVFNKDVQEWGVQDNSLTTVHEFYVAPYANPTSDTAKYRGFDLPSNLRVVVVYKGYNGGFICRPTGCNQVAVYSDYFQSVGDCCSNYAGSVHFPYEYRLFTTMDTVKIRIPNGYSVDSSHIWYVFTTGAGKAGSKRFTITPVSVVGDVYSFLLTPIYNFAGGSQVPSTTGSYWQMYNYIKASCTVPAGSIQTQYTADRWMGRNTWTGISLRGVAANHNRGNYEYQQAPQIKLSAITATTVSATNKTAIWDIRIQNTAASAAALNTWLGFRSATGQIIVDSVKRISTGTKLTAINGIYQAGTVNAAGANVDLRVYARYATCSLDSINLIIGWNCKNYPLNLSAAVGSCRSDSIKLFVQSLQPLVQTDLIAQPADPIALCDTLKYTIGISNRQIAAGYGITLDVAIPNAGIGASFSGAVQYRYPYNSGSWINITPKALGGGIYRLYLSDSIAAISANGLLPIGNAPFNELYVRYKFITNCNFISGNYFKFTVNSKQACGAAMASDIEFDQINIIGAPSPKFYFVNISAPQLWTCNINRTVRVAARNLELFATGANERLIITLPSGAYFVPGSLSFIRNPFPASTPIIDTVFGIQRLRWTAQSIPALDSTVLQFSYTSPSDIECGITEEITGVMASAFTASCGAFTCNSQVENGRKDLTRAVLKPYIQYSTGTGSILVVQDTTIGNVFWPDTLSVAGLEFINYGNDTADQPIVKFFNDVNNNGKRDVGESFLLIDTLPILKPAAVKYYTKTKLFAHKTLPNPNKIKLQVSQKCNCDSTVSHYAPPRNYVPLTMSDLDLEASLYQKNSAKLNWVYRLQNACKYFEIYRKLSNSNQWTLAAVVVADSANKNKQAYSWIDYSIPFNSDMALYKVKAVTINSKMLWSNIKAVVFNLDLPWNKGIAIWPNPATSAFTIANSFGAGFSYQLYDASGKIIVVGKSNLQTVNINITTIPGGIYFVKVIGEWGISTQKLVIQNH